MREYLVYVIVRIFGALIRRLPMSVTLWIGRRMGSMGYYFDRRHRSLAYANLKRAFASQKSPIEIKKITKRLFQNYGQNLIDVFRLPLIHTRGVDQFVNVEGKEYVQESLRAGKGLILLAMHFGSWEITSLMRYLLNHPYKVITKAQSKFSMLDELLNSYRRVGGATVIQRGAGMREVITSLRNNEIVAMVVDQGGRDGRMVKFFGRLASMSIGAIRMGLKSNVPICFCVIIRQEGFRHRLVIHPPLDLVRTGDLEKDIIANLDNITKVMEDYIFRYPAEYMWFYKIWKYSKESKIVILNDGKTGHLRQSQSVAQKVGGALKARDISPNTEILDIRFKNKMASRILNVLSLFFPVFVSQGRISVLKYFLTEESYQAFSSSTADFVISCGSSVAVINYLLSLENRAKSLCILKPGLLNFRHFTLVILPRHDIGSHDRAASGILVTDGALNLVTKDYLEEQSRLLITRYSHLKEKGKRKLTVGILLGGEAKNETLNAAQVKTFLGQIKGACERISAEILCTTSRRTPSSVENIVIRELKGHDLSRVLIIANRKNIPEAVGGILGLSDILVVSGDSISMVSEAASSGKNTIVFRAKKKRKRFKKDRHDLFLDYLHRKGYIFLADERQIGQAVLDMAKTKIKTKTLKDNDAIMQRVERII